MFKGICTLLASSALLFAGAAQAAQDYLIKINGISGTSDVRGFEDYINIESWSLGFTRGQCQALHFVKPMDTASSALTEATLVGTYFTPVTLIARKTGGDGTYFTYMKLTLTNSVFTSFQTGGSNGSSILPMEQVTLQPSSVKIELYEQNVGGVGETVVATNSVTCQKPK